MIAITFISVIFNTFLVPGIYGEKKEKEIMMLCHGDVLALFMDIVMVSIWVAINSLTRSFIYLFFLFLHL